MSSQLEDRIHTLSTQVHDRVDRCDISYNVVNGILDKHGGRAERNGSPVVSDVDRRGREDEERERRQEVERLRVREWDMQRERAQEEVERRREEQILEAAAHEFVEMKRQLSEQAKEIKLLHHIVESRSQVCIHSISLAR